MASESSSSRRSGSATKSAALAYDAWHHALRARWRRAWLDWAFAVALSDPEAPALLGLAEDATAAVLGVAALAGVGSGFATVVDAGVRIDPGPDTFADEAPAPVPGDPNGVRFRLLGGAFEEAARRLRRKIPRMADEVNAFRQAARVMAQKLVAAVAPSVRRRMLVARDRARAQVEDSFWISGASRDQLEAARKYLVGSVLRSGVEEEPGHIGFLKALRAAGVDKTPSQIEGIYRTNMNAVYSASHARTLSRPEVRRFVPLVMLVEIHDRRTRGAPNGIYARGGPRNPGWHWQMHGLIQTADWFREMNLVPPNGYSCRGSLLGITLGEAKRRGLVAPDGGVDWGAVALHNRDRMDIVARGDYPDPGFKIAA